MIIDLSLLNKFQRFSDWCQKWFGIDNFTLAQICLVIVLLSGLISILVDLVNGFKFVLVFVVLCYLYFFVSMMDLVKRLSIACSNNPNFINPFFFAFFVRYAGWMISLAQWIRALMNIRLISKLDSGTSEYICAVSDLFYLVWGLFFLFFVYFMSCTPKPKKPSRFRKFIKETANKIKESFTPNPVPQTAIVRS